ncbi:MAG: 16S rRNA (cytosine(1402)-N(4))-methyltransferase RsmH [Rhodospirillales bacterium]|nr:16S rRNA (cytosine(1402)-N(4))-methyltransferase RsmH [Rhodospirillales bacterium]
MTAPLGLVALPVWLPAGRPAGPAPASPAGGEPASGHVPVLRAEVLAALAPRDGGIYLDATFGGGGYAEAILSAAACTVFAIDRDPEAIARGAALAARFPGRLHLAQGRFGDVLAGALAPDGLLAGHGVRALDGVAFDLGVSSFQLDDPARGFSFRTDGPLDMRMDRAGPTASDLVNRLGERELADLLHEFGEERAARRIARAIVAARAEAPIETTARLAGIIRAVLPPDRSGIDPATRSFQALRIRVNDELGEIERGLEAAAALLAPGGRLVVVAFHSLEDRLVKRFMLAASGRAPSPSRHDPRGLLVREAPRFHLLGGALLRPGTAEVAANPRARSGRLRAMERLVRPVEAGSPERAGRGAAHPGGAAAGEGAT